MNSKNKGKIGEEEAVSFLEKKGYKILHRNWHFGHREIDIIAQYGQVVVMVEVKIRSKNNPLTLSELVPLRKQKHLIEAANHFVMKSNINHEIRFDIILIIYDYNSIVIEHVENAFYPKVRR